MSSHIYWCPASGRTLLPDDLKYILRDAANHDFPLEVCKEDIGYFRGLAHAGVSGAAAVIEAIERHGRIRLTLES